MPINIIVAPTIEERVALGRRTNKVDNGAIVPFPTDWPAGALRDSMTRGALLRISSLRSEGYRVTAAHWYSEASGSLIAGALRFDHESKEKRKQVLPLRSIGNVGDMPRLDLKAIEAPRPLYNLFELTSRPEAPVLVVEGEKAAEAGRSSFPDYVVTTWSGGAQGVLMADIRPLLGRSVAIWPDNDADGLAAADKLGNALQKLGLRDLRVVTVPDYFPKKWDVADPVPMVNNGRS